MSSRRSKTLVPLAVAMVASVWVASASSSSLDSQEQFCPAGFTRPAGENPRSATVLVPMAPRELLVCRYYGLNEPSGHPAGTLAAERLSSPRRADPIAGP